MRATMATATVFFEKREWEAKEREIEGEDRKVPGARTFFLFR
jgi:hypothetical protein